MEMVKKLEKKLGDLYKDLPALPKNVKETLATIWPWVALVLGVLQLAAAWSLWRLFDRAQPLLDLANQYSQYFTGESIGYSSFEKTMIYVAIAMLVVQGAIMLMAFGPLKNRLKRGWDLVFLSALVSVAYAVVTIFIDARGFGSFVVSIVLTGVGLYFLFQLKDLYSDKGAAKPKAPVA